jgi:hypothetical protein
MYFLRNINIVGILKIVKKFQYFIILNLYINYKSTGHKFEHVNINT